MLWSSKRISFGAGRHLWRFIGPLLILVPALEKEIRAAFISVLGGGRGVVERERRDVCPIKRGGQMPKLGQ